MRDAENRGTFFYGPVQSNRGAINNEDEEEEEEEEDNFDDAPEASKPMAAPQIKQASPINPPAPVPTSTISKVSVVAESFPLFTVVRVLLVLASDGIINDQ